MHLKGRASRPPFHFSQSGMADRQRLRARSRFDGNAPAKPADLPRGNARQARNCVPIAIHHESNIETPHARRRPRQQGPASLRDGRRRLTPPSPIIGLSPASSPSPTPRCRRPCGARASARGSCAARWRRPARDGLKVVPRCSFVSAYLAQASRIQRPGAIGAMAKILRRTISHRAGQARASRPPRSGRSQGLPRPQGRRRSKARRTARPSTSCRTGSTPKASARCWWCCKAPTPPARTAPSSTSSRRPARSASPSPRSRGRARRNWRMTSSGARMSAAPRRGFIGIFNRSHYEDVLVGRVRKLAPKDEIEARYDQINAFEKILAENGTTNSQIHAAHLQEGAARTPAGPARRAARAAGSSIRPTSTTASSGTSSWRPTS